MPWPTSARGQSCARKGLTPVGTCWGGGQRVWIARGLNRWGGGEGLGVLDGKKKGLPSNKFQLTGDDDPCVKWEGKYAHIVVSTRHKS